VLLATVFGSFIKLESFTNIDIAVYSLDTRFDYIAKFGAKPELELCIPAGTALITELDPYFKRSNLTKGRVILERLSGVYEALLKEQ